MSFPGADHTSRLPPRRPARSTIPARPSLPSAVRSAGRVGEAEALSAARHGNNGGVLSRLEEVPLGTVHTHQVHDPGGANHGLPQAQRPTCRQTGRTGRRGSFAPCRRSVRVWRGLLMVANHTDSCRCSAPGATENRAIAAGGLSVGNSGLQSGIMSGMAQKEDNRSWTASNLKEVQE